MNPISLVLTDKVARTPRAERHQRRNKMRAFVSVLTASLLVAASASAQTPMSNEAYLQTARCAGLISGAREDASAYDRALRAQQGGRDRSVRNAAAAHRRSADNQMRRADDATRARLTAEVSARCTAPTA